MYKMGKEERKRRGKLGREWMQTEEAGMTAQMMSKKFIEGIDKTLEKWTPKVRYNIYRI